LVSQRKIQQESLSKLSDLIQEDLSGISAIKIYAQEEAEKKEFNNYNKVYRNSAIKLARTASTLFPLLQGISSISLLILLGLGTSQLENGFITIGGLVALILFVEKCTKSKENHIVITHGTDTMTDTARELGLKKLNKTIVLTGAMIPYKFGTSDGLFNIASALAYVQTLTKGVYVAMNGRVFTHDKVIKNKNTGIFEEII
jgi:ABC-type multidrug transport system fused ATPase/permease subunit